MLGIGLTSSESTRPDPKGTSVFFQLEGGCVSCQPAICWGSEGLTGKHLIDVFPHCVEAVRSVMEPKALTCNDYPSRIDGLLWGVEDECLTLQVEHIQENDRLVDAGCESVLKRGSPKHRVLSCTM